MTDLTAEQLVEKLREYSDSDDHPINLAATLIEQQAEQIAGRTADNKLLKHTGLKWKLELNRADSEVAALRKVIEDAPHASGCRQVRLGHLGPCSCWKSKALPEKETP